MKKISTNQWTRREFTEQSLRSVPAVLAMLSGVTITVSGCGDSSSPATPSTPTPTTTTPPTTMTPPTTTPPVTQGVTGVVSVNHGHTAEVTAAELTAGSGFNLDITGDADHTHTVNLTAGDVGQIAAGTRVQKMSTNNAAHNHFVTFN
jgi:type IV pilus biogenesis protein CpaD/CtpE